MNVQLVAYLCAAWLLLSGLHGIVRSRNLVHVVVCMTVAQASTYVLLIGVGYRPDAIPPIYPEAPLTTAAVDPVVQSLAVTDAVVSATVTALLLALVLQVHKRTGSLDPASLRSLRG